MTMMRVDLPSPIPPGGRLRFPSNGGITLITMLPTERVRVMSIFQRMGTALMSLHSFSLAWRCTMMLKDGRITNFGGMENLL